MGTHRCGCGSWSSSPPLPHLHCQVLLWQEETQEEGESQHDCSQQLHHNQPRASCFPLSPTSLLSEVCCRAAWSWGWWEHGMAGDVVEHVLRVVLLSATGPARDGGPGAGHRADGAREAAVLPRVQLPCAGGGDARGRVPAGKRLCSCMVPLCYPLRWTIPSWTSPPACSLPALLPAWHGGILPAALASH